MPESRMFDAVYRAHWFLWKSWEHPGFVRTLRDLEQEANLSRQEWQNLQEDRLRRILRHAEEHVPYYQTRFKRAGCSSASPQILDALARLPILTKHDLVACSQELLNHSLTEGQRLQNATGGSTGQPVVFWQDRRYRQVAVALDAHVSSWWGISPWDRQASVWGADRDFSKLNWRGRFYNWRSRYRGLNAFRMTPDDMRQFCKMLAMWRPPSLRGYASALNQFALFAEAEGIHDLQFRAIRSSAEMLYPHYRRTIERVFRSPVYDFYGSREVNNLATQCPEENRMHLISAWRYVEITDEQGNCLPPGEPGYITVTDCSNQAMPFIRYRNDDIGVLSADPCPCGRPTPVLERLLGRCTDLIRTRTGKMIHGEFFTHLFYGRNDIAAFQVRQTSVDHLVLCYVPVGDTAHAFVRSLHDPISREMGPTLSIAFEACSVIPVTSSGKHRFTICEI